MTYQLTVLYHQPEDAAAFLKAQMALWATTTKELGIEPQ